MIQTTNISLIPSDNKPVINVSQFDNLLRVLRFNVFDDAGMETPHVFDNTETVLLNIRKNDNNIVVITGEIITETDPETQEVTGYYITFELTEQACACVGSNYGEVSITSGDDEVIGSCNFKLIVERSPLAGGLTSQSAIDNLTTQIENITEQVIGDNYYDKNEVDGLITGVEDEIPTKTSDLDNDSGFITASDIPTIPTKTSELTNDSDFINSTELNNVLSDYALWPTDQTTKSSIANFTTSLALPLVALKAYIQAQGGGGTPTTPIAIVGVSAVNVYRRGVNLWDEEWEVGTFDNTTGIKKDFNQYWRSKNPINIKPNTTYYAFTSGDNIFRFYYDINGNYIGNASGVINQTFTTPANAYYLNIVDVSGNSYDASLKPISINYPSTDTNYHAYNPQSDTFTLNLGQTVYGGYIDWDNGKLVITYAIVDMGNVTWNIRSGTTDTFYHTPTGAKILFKGTCSCYPKVSTSASSLGDKEWTSTGGNNLSFWFRDTDFDNYTGEQVASALTGQKFIYELATPIEISLPTTMPQTIQGVQNWWADSGDIEVSYKCTIEEYVNNRLSSTRTLNRTVTLEERRIEENLSETRDMRGYDNEE